MRKCVLLLTIACFVLLPLTAQVTLTRQDNTQIDITIDGKPFSTLFFGPNTLKPYMWPLRAADGKIVTRQWPIAEAPGEAHDHPHHRGLWFAHGEVNGLDFWAPETPGASEFKPGRISLEKVVEVKSGKKAGSMVVMFDWKDQSGQTLITETRKTIIYGDPKLRILDFDITLKADQKVVFGDTKEGTFAIRLAQPLCEPAAKPQPGITPGTGLMTTAEGKQGEKNVWGKRSKWVDYAGTLDGEKLGIAIFDHPGNPKHPTYWHSRSYGLFAANIFGEHDFYNDKGRNGSVTLAPGQSLRFRYRVVIHPGDAQEAGIEALYRKYAGGKETGPGTE
ncbi:MAG TPA: PmoA family protein [Bryobacterales bacterium]|jgi:hypothetical protein|nr:PmoA family protein [Bryobacterales bacterium]